MRCPHWYQGRRCWKSRHRFGRHVYNWMQPDGWAWAMKPSERRHLPACVDKDSKVECVCGLEDDQRAWEGHEADREPDE